MSKDNGGPAFPFTDTDGSVCEGMTLRDYIAAKAMQGMCSRGGYGEWSHMAEDAYGIADAMLEARK